MTVALLALFVAFGGTGYAASQFNHPVAVAKKHKKHSDQAQDTALFKKLIKQQAAKLRGPRGPQGASGAAGAAGSTGSPGAPGTARAYGLVSSAGTLDPTVRKNVLGVTNPGAGTFCISLAGGIDPATTRPNATVTDDTDAGAGLFVLSGLQSGCPAGQLEVDTFQATDSGGVAGTAFQETSTNEGFFLSVP